MRLGEIRQGVIEPEHRDGEHDDEMKRRCRAPNVDANDRTEGVEKKPR